MNGFSAADMSTAAANGHAEGYQAGYADAVKAVEAGKDAAAQEADMVLIPAGSLSEMARELEGRIGVAKTLSDHEEHLMTLIVDAYERVEAAPVSAAQEAVYQIRHERGFWQDSSKERYDWAAEDGRESIWDRRILYAAPVAAAPVDAPSIESAHAMGAKGAPANDAERLAFEAWMRGHCCASCATGDGAGYRSDAEQGGGCCP
ncbi:hypothetical protein, partial [Stenotrophomonas sp. UBA7606]|uniref:hypothetical protein n=1 Tax=Stenotrophomonas sp. UBA7606 TaxID=1947559 RepID=UPI0026010650